MADLNADGKQDLVLDDGVDSAFQGFNLLTGDGTGGLTPGNLRAGGSPLSVAVMELDGDGDPDLVRTGAGTLWARCVGPGGPARSA